MKEKSALRKKSPGIVISLMFWTLIIVSGCQRPDRVSPDWHHEEQKRLQEIAGSELYSRNLTLSVSHVAALDEQTLLLGGSYRSPAAPVRSALLRSADGGKTWQDTGVWLTGFDTWRIFVLDQKHAFAAANYSIEGWLARSSSLARLTEEQPGIAASRNCLSSISVFLLERVFPLSALKTASSGLPDHPLLDIITSPKMVDVHGNSRT